MKKLLIALLIGLFSTSVFAEIIATLPNRANGFIYFTDTHCSGRGAYWKILYSVSDSGGASYGCWFYESGMVHVRWDSGNTSVFDAMALTIIKGNKGSI